MKQEFHRGDLSRKQKRTTHDIGGDQQIAALVLGGEDHDEHAGARAGDNPHSLILKTCKHATHPSENSQAQSEPTIAPMVDTCGVDHDDPPHPRQAMWHAEVSTGGNERGIATM
jgi:hypothetical protein